MDDFERAAEHEEEGRRIALKQHADRQRKAEPRDECEDCDEPLEPHRRQYGTCVECQTAREARAKHYRHD